ncbi:hypothetical protein [Alloalcanivorax xenomutans]|uniref:hypothetical protein n=1 Tax=Alloalcanivorax xenomutans TaxID=1094342 RepID=UPI003C531E16
MDATTRTLHILEQRRERLDIEVTIHLDRSYPPGEPVKIRNGKRWIRATVVKRPDELRFPYLAVETGQGKESHYHFSDVRHDRSNEPR